MVIKNLGLDKHSELRDMYFGNYTSATYLSQISGEELLPTAKKCSDKLGLKFRHIHTGLGSFEQALSVEDITR